MALWCVVLHLIVVIVIHIGYFGHYTISVIMLTVLICTYYRYGKIEGVKILPQKYPNIGVAAFIDFYDVKSATVAKEAKHRLEGHELRTNYKSNPGDRHESGRRSHDREKHAEKDRYREVDCFVLC